MHYDVVFGRCLEGVWKVFIAYLGLLGDFFEMCLSY